MTAGSASARSAVSVARWLAKTGADGAGHLDRQRAAGDRPAELSEPRLNGLGNRRSECRIDRVPHESAAASVSATIRPTSINEAVSRAVDRVIDCSRWPVLVCPARCARPRMPNRVLERRASSAAAIAWHRSTSCRSAVSDSMAAMSAASSSVPNAADEAFRPTSRRVRSGKSGGDSDMSHSLSGPPTFERTFHFCGELVETKHDEDKSQGWAAGGGRTGWVGWSGAGDGRRRWPGWVGGQEQAQATGRWAAGEGGQRRAHRDRATPRRSGGERTWGGSNAPWIWAPEPFAAS